MTEKLEAHLGGHSNKTWTDRGSLKYVKEQTKSKYYLDIGCGPGGQLQIALDLGMVGLGIDGDHTLTHSEELNVQIFDFTKGKIDKDNIKYIPDQGYFDICWTVEFLEHVNAEFIPNFMGAISLCEYVIMTNAIPGLGGHHHVNEQYFSYWEETFKKYGLKPDLDLTRGLRRMSTMKNKKKLSQISMPEDYLSKEFEYKKTSFIKRHGWVFVNKRLQKKIQDSQEVF